MDAPALDHDNCFYVGIEDLAIEQFVTEPAVEALIMSVLPL